MEDETEKLFQYLLDPLQNERHLATLLTKNLDFDSKRHVSPFQDEYLSKYFQQVS